MNGLEPKRCNICGEVIPGWALEHHASECRAPAQPADFERGRLQGREEILSIIDGTFGSKQLAEKIRKLELAAQPAGELREALEALADKMEERCGDHCSNSCKVCEYRNDLRLILVRTAALGRKGEWGNEGNLPTLSVL